MGIQQTTVVVAVHGIGDQVQFATVQQVARQFTRRLCGDEISIPLGHFHAVSAQANPVYFLPENESLGFAEAYWADIPRRVAGGGYTLEETKHWAKTVAERAAREQAIHGTRINYPLVSRVVGEMVDTIGTLQDVLFIANKAGVGQFDLNKILVDYVDDVQVVAEFTALRTEIVARFSDLLATIVAHNPGANIFIVAHSEGTVVAWLGLLLALWNPGATWIKQVRGLMTIGSPIDKHLVLWPDLFLDIDGSTRLSGEGGRPPINTVEPPIRWRNYYDYGDPVGFKLETARYWLEQRGISSFRFDGHVDDIGFTRYPVPGAAHNGYWEDNDVFDNFIASAVLPTATAPKRPSTRLWPLISSYVLSYAACFLLLAAGVWLLDHSMDEFAVGRSNVAKPVATNLAAAGNALGTAALLAGLTVLARVPRLVNPRIAWRWIVVACLIFIASAVVYTVTVTPEVRRNVGIIPDILIGLIPGVRTWMERSESAQELVDTCGAICLALVVALASWRWSRPHPNWGMKPLLIWGGTSILATIAWLVLENHNGNSPWPVFVSGVLLLYVWWLSALLFDLVFVWHRYIRNEVALDRLRHNVTGAREFHDEGAGTTLKSAA